MAFLENGSPVATKTGPIASVTTLISGRAVATAIFEIADTSRKWLAMPQTTAGVYSFVTSTGTATLFVYDTSYDLIQEIAVTSTAASTSIAVAFHRIECVASGALDLSCTPSNAKITASGGTFAFETITGSGNYGLGVINAAGSNTGYAAGQRAHVIAIGGSGGGGGDCFRNAKYGPVNNPGASGGLGGIDATTSAVTLSGTYALTIGAAGTGGNSSFSSSPGGNAGTITTGFSLIGNGGNGGGGGNNPGGPGPAGTAGTPALPANTDIYLTTTTGELGVAAGGANSPGSAGRILILRWTP